MDKQLLLTEITYRTSRASGAGGQHVNKTETKVEAILDLMNSSALTEEEKILLRRQLAQQITADGLISSTDQTTRYQLKNKDKATAKLIRLIEKGLVPPKKRKYKPVPPEIKEARLKEKKARSEVKSMRQKPIL